MFCAVSYVLITRLQTTTRKFESIVLILEGHNSPTKKNLYCETSTWKLVSIVILFPHASYKLRRIDKTLFQTWKHHFSDRRYARVCVMGSRCCWIIGTSLLELTSLCELTGWVNCCSEFCTFFCRGLDFDARLGQCVQPKSHKKTTKTQLWHFYNRLNLQIHHFEQLL